MATTVTPSAIAKLWRPEVPKEARYVGLRDLLEEDDAGRDSCSRGPTPGADRAAKELDEALPDYAPSVVGALLGDLRQGDTQAAECLALLVRVAGRRPASKLAPSLVEAGLTRQALSRAALDCARASLGDDDFDAVAAALEAYACAPRTGPEPPNYASRWCVVATTSLKKGSPRLETASLSVLDAVVRRASLDPAYATKARSSSLAGQRAGESPTQLDDDAFWDCALAARCADERPYVSRAVAATLRRAAPVLKRGRPLAEWLATHMLPDVLLPAWKDQLRRGIEVDRICDAIGALLDCCHPSPLFAGDAKPARALVPFLSECRNRATAALAKGNAEPLKAFFTAWDAVFRCLRGVDDARWERAARQHGKMLARPFAAQYVRAVPHAGAYGLALVTASCDEPRALERVLKSLGKAHSDDVDGDNVAALCERASSVLLARALSKLVRRCEEPYVVKATLVVLEHALRTNCDRHLICEVVQKLARRRIGRDELRSIACAAGGDVLGAYIGEGVDGHDLIAAARGDVSFADKVDGASLLNALTHAEASVDRDLLLVAWRAHPKHDAAQLWGWPLLSAIDRGHASGLEDAAAWGRALAKVGKRKSGDSVEAVAIVTTVRETLEDARHDVQTEVLTAACHFCAALLEAAGDGVCGLKRAVADAATILSRTALAHGAFGDLAAAIGTILAGSEDAELCADVCKAISPAVSQLLAGAVTFVGNVLDAIDGKDARLLAEAAPILAACFADQRVAKQADYAWTRIRPEDTVKQPMEVRAACGLYVRGGGREHPSTERKRPVEAPTPAAKRTKTPISGITGDSRTAYALAEVGTQSSQELTQAEAPRRANIAGVQANSQADLPAAWASRLHKPPSQSQG